MTQITGLGFSNFRVFKQDTFFELSPISVFTGTNNSGKSSIFKGLLLLADNTKRIDTLLFSGEHHKLGSYSYAKNKSSNNDEIQFSFKIDKEKNRLFPDGLLMFINYKQAPGMPEIGNLTSLFFALGEEFKYCYNNDDIILNLQKVKDDETLTLNLKYFIDRIQQYVLPDYLKYKETKAIRSQLDSKVLYKEDFGPYSDYDEVLEQLLGSNFSVALVEKLKPYLNSFPDATLTEVADTISEKVISYFSNVLVPYGYGYDIIGEPYAMWRTNMINICIEHLSQDKTIFKKLSDITVTECFDQELYENIVPFLDGVKLSDVVNPLFLTICKEIVAAELTKTWSSLKSELKSIVNIEGVRANSQRLYTNQSQGTSFNKLLLDVGHGWSYYSSVLRDESTDISFVNKWTAKFGIGDEIRISRVKGIATEVQVVRDGEEIDLIDLGYGATQFLPILITIVSKCKAKKDSEEWKWIFDSSTIKRTNGPLLLIEEPESNLHPKLQSLLADFFIDVAKHFIVTLLIETHSEYLIRRLQVLTAAGESKPEDSVIYYIDGNIPSDSDKFVKKININPDGSLTNDFGPGFIDEATNWKMELMRLKNAQLQNLN